MKTIIARLPGNHINQLDCTGVRAIVSRHWVGGLWGFLVRRLPQSWASVLRGQPRCPDCWGLMNGKTRSWSTQSKKIIVPIFTPSFAKLEEMSDFVVIVDIVRVHAVRMVPTFLKKSGITSCGLLTLGRREHRMCTRTTRRPCQLVICSNRRVHVFKPHRKSGEGSEICGGTGTSQYFELQGLFPRRTRQLPGNL